MWGFFCWLSWRYIKLYKNKIRIKVVINVFMFFLIFFLKNTQLIKCKATLTLMAWRLIKKCWNLSNFTHFLKNRFGHTLWGFHPSATIYTVSHKIYRILLPHTRLVLMVTMCVLFWMLYERTTKDLTSVHLVEFIFLFSAFRYFLCIIEQIIDRFVCGFYNLSI